jgi:GT2 family glycosyltransferase
MLKITDRLSVTTPHISVVLVTMNRVSMLERCLEGVQCQTFRDYEIIVIDNASTDGTGAVVQKRFPDVRYVRLARNVGVPAGRNRGVLEAKGDLLVFLDDDAVFDSPDALERIAACISDVDVPGLVALKIVSPGDKMEEYKSIPRADKKRIAHDYECSYFCGAGFAVRRELFMKAGMFWEPLFFIAEELDLSYRLMEQGCKMIRLANVIVIHNETPQARVPGQWLYFGVRNRLWVALHNLPWRYVASHIILWWGYFFIMAVISRHPFFFLRGMLDALKGIPVVLADRRVISKATIARLKSLSGRVYY